jgi:hypothetical protein
VNRLRSQQNGLGFLGTLYPPDRIGETSTNGQPPIMLSSHPSLESPLIASGISVVTIGLTAQARLIISFP